MTNDDELLCPILVSCDDSGRLRWCRSTRRSRKIGPPSDPLTDRPADPPTRATRRRTLCISPRGRVRVRSRRLLPLSQLPTPHLIRVWAVRTFEFNYRVDIVLELILAGFSSRPLMRPPARPPDRLPARLPVAVLAGTRDCAPLASRILLPVAPLEIPKLYVAK